MEGFPGTLPGNTAGGRGTLYVARISSILAGKEHEGSDREGREMAEGVRLREHAVVHPLVLAKAGPSIGGRAARSRWH